jgi:hypothetical protein
MLHRPDDWSQENADTLREIKPHEIELRRQLVAEILDYSPHASTDFLSRFTSDQLQAYLEHLQLAQKPRGNQPWIRRNNSPAVVAYRPSA